ncbi:cytochrome c oxidase subunit I [Azotobacter chroococcum]|uniref:cytochrome c oxidase subunit I n=1 Tax=Azotobacter chroococcum TaxID=353 RepID=UPI00103AED96|nr:cytochrome c oxidase subunit I [Azotobacter chroococcum]TBW35427.1 cytochrome c oxidase subunit I [Azotobacter chroococcum]
MSETRAQSPERLHQDFHAVWGNPTGWRALSIVNHSSIGLRFMLTGTVFFLIGGLLAMLLRAQLARPELPLIDHQTYNQLFTLHGSVMMFLFAVPMVEGLAVYLIPKMLGARDLVFPRLSAFGYWCYLFGGTILVSSLALGLAPNGGWFMYTPLSSAAHSPGVNADFWLIGITFVEISSVAGGVELAVSILRSRAPGMSLDRMPLFAWYMLVTSLMIVFGFPPLILGSILLELERAAGFAFFDVARGGDPLLWQHLFWLFGHPEVYIIFLPAAGIVSTLLPVFARRPLVGYRWLVLAVIGTGFLSFGLWVHHMFTVGIPLLGQAFFSAASMLVAVPTGIQVFAWLATLWTGRPLFNVPMLWLVGFLVIFVAGGLTGVMLALVPFDWQVHDSHFVVAHMHYVLVGGMLFPLIAGLYYWLPHFSGRLPSERLGRWGFWLTFVGFNATFLVMHWTGLLGMPRRVYTYPAGLGWDLPNLISSVGSFVMAMGVAMVLLDIGLHFRFGRRAGDNPWQADTLEWATALPPAAYNFVSLPACTSRHPLWENPALGQSIAEGRHGLPTIDHGRRETWGSDPLSGQVREIIHLPGNSWLPLYAALVLTVVCLSLLNGAYALAGVAALATLGILLRWSWVNGAHPLAAPDARTRPGDPPLHSRTFDGPGLWGMGTTLLANGVLFFSLIFAWFYLWTVAPNWQPPARSPLPGLALLLDGLLLGAIALGFRLLLRRLRRGNHRRLEGALWMLAALGLLQAAGLAWVLAATPLAPTASAHDALIAVTLGYLLLHCALAPLFTALQAWRVHLELVGERAPYEPAVVLQWWDYCLLTFWVSYFALVLFPRGIGA